MSNLLPTASRTITSKYWASRNTYWIRARGTPFQVWHGSQTPDTNPASPTFGAETELPVTLIGSTMGLFLQKGAAEGVATRVGVGPEQQVEVVFPKEDAFLLDQRDYLLDNAGNCWLITSFPDRQRDGPFDANIIGCIGLLEFQAERPIGMPQTATEDED